MNIDPSILLKMKPDDFALLHSAGCRRISVAIESGSERIRALLKKPADVKRILEINRNLSRNLIVPNYVFMMGLPTETKSDLAETISLAFRLTNENLNAGTSFNIYTPYPGTELFDIAVKYGLNVPQRIEDWISFNYRNLTQNGPWLSKEMRKIVKMLDFCSFFIGQRPLLQPTEETSMLGTLLGRLYAPLAKRRAENLWYHFPVEIKLAKSFKVYEK